MNYIFSPIVNAYYNYTRKPVKPYLVLLQEYGECPPGCIFFKPYCFQNEAQKGKLTSVETNTDDLKLLCEMINCPPDKGKYTFKTPYMMNETNQCVLKDDFKSYIESILSGDTKKHFNPTEFIKCWVQIWEIEAGYYYLQKTNNEVLTKREMYMKFDKELNKARQTFVDNYTEIKKLQKELN